MGPENRSQCIIMRPILPLINTIIKEQCRQSWAYASLASSPTNWMEATGTLSLNTLLIQNVRNWLCSELLHDLMAVPTNEAAIPITKFGKHIPSCDLLLGLRTTLLLMTTPAEAAAPSVTTPWATVYGCCSALYHARRFIISLNNRKFRFLENSASAKR